MFNLKSLRISLLIAILSLGFSQTNHAQLSLDNSLSAQEMAELLSGSGVIITNARLIGADHATGSFSNGDNTNIGLNSGLILTTGDIENAKGPNDSRRKDRINNTNGDADLRALAGFNTNDAAILEFDLESIGTEVSFHYVFASEEYPEYVCSKYNDVFAFFVSGPNPDGGPAYDKKNIALISEASNLAVAINSVNSGRPGGSRPASGCTSLDHADKYQDNATTDPNYDGSIQYDGFTKKLTATVRLVPCQTYRFRLGIADSGDSSYDSAVFLEEGSFVSNTPLVTAAETAVSCEGACDGSIDLEVESGTAPYTYNWGHTDDDSQDQSNLCAGNYRVTVTDVNGCTETLSIEVTTTEDVTNPMVNCPANISQANRSNDCGNTVDFSITATDNCSAPANISITSSPASGSFFELGTTVVTSTAVDEAGRRSQCTFNVTITDEEQPTISCPNNISRFNTANDCGRVVEFTTVATDNCSAPAAINITSTPSSGSFFTVGTTTVTSTTTDEAGNQSTCSFQVEIKDNEKPTIVCPTNISRLTRSNDCGNVVDFAISALDNCSAPAAISITSNPSSGSFFAVGTTTVTNTAVDEAGMQSRCTFKVTIRDQERPQVNCPSNTVISCEEDRSPANTGQLTAEDNCGVASISFKDISTTGSCNDELTIVRNWQVLDVHENIVRCAQTITITDNIAPQITCPAAVVVSCDISVANTGMATAVDNCDPNLAITFSDTQTGGDCAWQCFTDRTFQVTDACGNTSTCQQRIEKNTLPLLEKALSSDSNIDGIIMGDPETAISLQIPTDKAACILDWLPDTDDDNPNSLLRGNQVVADDCKPGTNPLDRQGRLDNPLLAAGLHLQLYLRLDPEFGNTQLEDLDCEIAPIVMQNVRREPTVNRLMHVTHEALSNLVLVPHRKELLEALRCITKDLKVCDTETDAITANE